MSREGISVDQSKPERLMSPKAEDDVPETPPGCEGWTAEMEEHVKDFLQGVDIEQVEAELYCLFPTTENMTGLTGYLEKMKEGLEAQESDRVQKEQSSEQPAGWTNKMTEFVEGCLCGGNDVKATVKLFRLEVAEAFSIQGLEEHVEKLKNEYVNKNRPDVQQDHMPREPLGWTDEMTTIVQDYLRNGDRNVDLMVQSLEIVEENTLYIEGVYEYVAKLKSDFEAQEQDQTEENRPLEQLSGQPDGWTESLTTLLHLLLQKYEDDAEVVQQIHDCWDSSIYMKDLEQYVAKTRVELKARDEDGMQHD